MREKREREEEEEEEGRVKGGNIEDMMEGSCSDGNV